MNSTFAYGPPTDETEYRALGTILMQGLAPTPPTDDGWFAGWRNRVGELGFARVVTHEGRVVGGLVSFAMGHFVGRRSVPTGGVASVAIAPEHRLRGAATFLMRAYIEELAAMGTPLSTLTPASQALYRKAGYDLAGVCVTYQLPAHALDVRRKDLTVRPATEADHAAMFACYAERARQGNGAFDRSPAFWKHRVLGTLQKPNFAYVVERDGVLDGYVVFAHEAEPTVRYNVMVKDLAARSQAGYENLLTLLAAHGSMSPFVFLHGGVVEPALLLLGEQFDRAIARRCDWMLRVVDVAKALSGRGYLRGVSGTLDLTVDDDLVAANRGPWRLTVRDGVGTVERGGTGAMRVSVQGLASLYAGYASPETLRLAGRLQGDADSLAIAEALFAGPMPSMPDEF